MKDLTNEHHRRQLTVESPLVAPLFAFTGGVLDSFLYLNHGHVFAGVMTGNAVLMGASVFDPTMDGPGHYFLPLFAYFCGISIIAAWAAMFKGMFVRTSLSLFCAGLFALSFAPATMNETLFVFMVVLLTGFFVGISRHAGSVAYNATVITGTLRDGTLALFQILNPVGRASAVSRTVEAWSVILSFIAGAIAGGLLSRQFGNQTLWLPAATAGVVLVFVFAKARSTESNDLARS